MTAPTETPRLTTEQARGLASRWVTLRSHLATHDREQLFAWVRARMKDWGNNGTSSFRKLGSRLSLNDGQTDALLRAAGWPS